VPATGRHQVRCSHTRAGLRRPHSGNHLVLSGPSVPRLSPDATRFAYWLSVRNLVTCRIWDPDCSFQHTDYTLVSRSTASLPPRSFGAVRDYRDHSGREQLPAGLELRPGRQGRRDLAGRCRRSRPGPIVRHARRRADIGQGQLSRKATSSPPSAEPTPSVRHRSSSTSTTSRADTRPSRRPSATCEHGALGRDYAPPLGDARTPRQHATGAVGRR
jgi:hypothetical protein